MRETGEKSTGYTNNLSSSIERSATCCIALAPLRSRASVHSERGAATIGNLRQFSATFDALGDISATRGGLQHCYQYRVSAAGGAVLDVELISNPKFVVCGRELLQFILLFRFNKLYIVIFLDYLHFSAYCLIMYITILNSESITKYSYEE